MQHRLLRALAILEAVWTLLMRWTGKLISLQLTQLFWLCKPHVRGAWFANESHSTGRSVSGIMAALETDEHMKKCSHCPCCSVIYNRT